MKSDADARMDREVSSAFSESGGEKPYFVTLKRSLLDRSSRPASLFLEYAQSLGFSLCFQNFDKELAGCPAITARQMGDILAEFEGGPQDALPCTNWNRQLRDEAAVLAS